MARNLKNLADSMRKRAASLDDFGNEVTKDAALAGLRELVVVTPVDTSEAVSNWQVEIGSRPSSQIPPHFLGRRGSTRGASSAKAVQEGEAAINSKQPGAPIYLSNTARHIVELDRGTSTQFSGGFIPLALIIIRAAAQKAAKRLFK